MFYCIYNYKVKRPVIKPEKKKIDRTEYCKDKLNTEEPKQLKYYVNKFLKLDKKTELLLTYNKLNSLNSDLLKEVINIKRI